MFCSTEFREAFVALTFFRSSMRCYATAHISTMILPLAPQGDFRNEPFTDFRPAKPACHEGCAGCSVGDQLGHEYELIIGGERLADHRKIESRIRRGRRRWLAFIRRPGPEHAELAMSAALEGI